MVLEDTFEVELKSPHLALQTSIGTPMTTTSRTEKEEKAVH
jgi:hypothetical protein